MKKHKHEPTEAISDYLRGGLDKKAEGAVERALVSESEYFRIFMEKCESAQQSAPPGLAASVMSEITAREEYRAGNRTGLPYTPGEYPATTVCVLPAHAPVVRVPVLSRKLCAAACFCGAAAVMLFAVFGFDRQLTEFFVGTAAKLSELIGEINMIP